MISYSISENEFKEIMNRFHSLLSKFSKESISVTEFISNYRTITNTLNQRVLYFSEPVEFYDFLKIYHGEEAAMKNLEHELEHMNIDSKHGLKSKLGITFVYPNNESPPYKLNQLKELPMVPMVELTEDSLDILSTWNKNQLIEYLRDSYEVQTLSSSDKEAINALSSKK